MMRRFESWLGSQMQVHGVRSAGRLAREAGLEPARVADWVVGRSVPDDHECGQLAIYFNVAVEEVMVLAEESRQRKPGSASQPRT